MLDAVLDKYLQYQRGYGIMVKTFWHIDCNVKVGFEPGLLKMDVFFKQVYFLAYQDQFLIPAAEHVPEEI